MAHLGSLLPIFTANISYYTACLTPCVIVNQNAIKTGVIKTVMVNVRAIKNVYCHNISSTNTYLE